MGKPQLPLFASTCNEARWRSLAENPRAAQTAGTPSIGAVTPHLLSSGLSYLMRYPPVRMRSTVGRGRPSLRGTRKRRCAAPVGRVRCCAVPVDGVDCLGSPGIPGSSARRGGNATERDPGAVVSDRMRRFWPAQVLTGGLVEPMLILPATVSRPAGILCQGGTKHV